MVGRSGTVQTRAAADGFQQRVLLGQSLATKQGGGIAVQFMEYRFFHFLWRAMSLLHHIYGVFKKHTLAKSELLAARRLAQRRPQVGHPPHFLDSDRQRGALALGEGGPDAVDDDVIGAVADGLCVVRDGPRFVILGTRK
jgi:hypothetical protein